MTQPENQLIRSLPRIDRLRLLALCEPVQLELAQVLVEAGSPISQVLFPVEGFVSQVTQVPGHPGLEVGMIGHEGLVGVSLALGVSAAPVRSIVQGAGSAWRLGSVHFGRELLQSEPMRRTLHRYLYVTMVQLATASACRRFHELGPRLARWLLMSHDRAHADTFHVTHEFLGMMLGVRRVGVTVAAGELQAEGLIHYHPRHDGRAQPHRPGSARLHLLCRRPGGVPRADGSLNAGGVAQAAWRGRPTPLQMAVRSGSSRSYSFLTTA